MFKFKSDAPARTAELARRLAGVLRPGTVICLDGDLGAGKTLLSRGIATALGVAPEAVTSPTFAIMNVYEGRELEVRHFDLYRLNRPEELEDIGFAEYAGGEGVTLIEWAELFGEQLPEEYLQVVLRHEGAGRRAVLEAHGQRYEQLLEEVEKDADFSH